MNILLVGYGKMARAVEAVARDRGHSVVARVHPSAEAPGSYRSLEEAPLGDADVVFEFTEPAAARPIVERLLAQGCRVVSGTTGWQPDSAGLGRLAAEHGGACLWAPNFSLGVALLYEVAEVLASRLARLGGYDPYVFEHHHRGKRDAPSGTARRLAEGIQRAYGGVARVEGLGAGGPPPAGAVHVAAIRAGVEPGRHTAGFEGAYDALTLEHRARDRRAFAEGAVRAGEWIRHRTGWVEFRECFRDLVDGGGSSSAPQDGDGGKDG